MHTLALDVATPASQLRLLLERLQVMVASDEMVEKSDGWPRVRCVGVQIGRIEVELRAYVLTTSLTKFLATQESLLLAVLELVEELGVKLARPVSPFRKRREHPALKNSARVLISSGNGSGQEWATRSSFWEDGDGARWLKCTTQSTQPGRTQRATACPCQLAPF
ncbi:hypothetical protein [Achromobacter sp. Root83]|uniref:hypothetical protein n=1 Tax=Achromobacter sp. Root83 TaxID=1736602 RepID=UPI00070AF17D|nr:hypothetical protein [Achromobacter sp. Root83]